VRVTVFGKGHVGGGLAGLWEQAGHQVTRLGRDGGDVADADVVVVAVPGGAVPTAMERLTGSKDKAVIDATNRFGEDPPEGFASNAQFIKSVTGGPTAKSFNVNCASLYGHLAAARVKPSNLWCGDEELRETVEQLIRDAGYEPVCIGTIERAAAQERVIDVIFAISEQIGDYVYRFAPIDQL
jgi:8-hydroxy-5-deazaflavin:NADPH oxidoreductase